MSNKHNEPAFPVAISVGPNDQAELYKGMTLRDWFAGLAMQAMVQSEDYEWTNDHIAREAYDIADLMLQVREQKK